MLLCFGYDGDAFADHYRRDPLGRPRSLAGIVDRGERLERDGIEGIF
jgi:hypothetical protein